MEAATEKRKSFFARYLAVCALVAATLGCQTDPGKALLERDLREEENAIYKLRDALEDSRQQLACSQQENQDLRRQLGGGGAVQSHGPEDSSRGAWRRGKPALGPGAAATRPGIVSQRAAAPDREPEAGGEAPPSPWAPVQKPSPPATDGSGAPVIQGTLAAAAPPGLLVANNRGLDAVHSVLPAVRQITLNPELTGAYRRTGRTADDGNRVLIEPRDARGRLIQAPGAVSIVLLDRQAQGQLARLGRWDFSSAETAATWGQLPQGQGICLELPWPAGPPPHSRLLLAVRMSPTTAGSSKQPCRSRFACRARGRRDAAQGPAPVEREVDAQVQPASNGVDREVVAARRASN